MDHSKFYDPADREGGEEYDPEVEFEEFDEPKPMTGDNPLDEGETA